METVDYDLDKKIVADYEKNYLDGVTILKRKRSPVTLSKKVNVYVDGILTSMAEDLLNHLIDIGFYIVVRKKH